MWNRKGHKKAADMARQRGEDLISRQANMPERKKKVKPALKQKQKQKQSQSVHVHISQPKRRAAARRAPQIAYQGNPSGYSLPPQLTYLPAPAAAEPAKGSILGEEPLAISKRTTQIQTSNDIGPQEMDDIKAAPIMGKPPSYSSALDRLTQTLRDRTPARPINTPAKPAEKPKRVLKMDPKSIKRREKERENRMKAQQAAASDPLQVIPDA